MLLVFEFRVESSEKETEMERDKYLRRWDERREGGEYWMARGRGPLASPSPRAADACSRTSVGVR